MNGQARLIYGPSTSNLVSPVTHILGYGVQKDTSDGDMTFAYTVVLMQGKSAQWVEGHSSD